LRSPAREARAVNRVRRATNDRFDQCRYVGWVVLHISVLDDDDLTSHVRNGGSDRRPLAAIRLPKEEDVIAVRRPLRDDCGGLVDRAIIDHDHLLIQVKGIDSLQYLLDGRRFVVRRDEERYPHEISARSAGAPLPDGLAPRAKKAEG
jgi:hypothetical protein